MSWTGPSSYTQHLCDTRMTGGCNLSCGWFWADGHGWAGEWSIARAIGVSLRAVLALGNSGTLQDVHTCKHEMLPAREHRSRQVGVSYVPSSWGPLAVPLALIAKAANWEGPRVGRSGYSSRTPCWPFRGCSDNYRRSPEPLHLLAPFSLVCHAHLVRIQPQPTMRAPC